MARPLRIEYPGAHYHVINRGNAGEIIFTSDRDHEKFLEYLAILHDRFAITIHSYCLMSNHYHLLIETPQANLSAAIQWLNVSYAAYFNKKHNRQGHLFQGRFKAVLVDADEYLTQVSRYIHLNPVKAGMVKNPQEYLWSNYGELIGERDTPEWLDASLLGYFGQQRKKAIQQYRAFVEEVDIDNVVNPDSLSFGNYILGDTDFVHWVQETFLADKKDDKEIPQIKKLRGAISLDSIVDVVAESTGVTAETIRSKGKKRNQPREIAIYLAQRLGNQSGVELGKYFGGISGAAITLCCKQCGIKAEKDENLRRVIAEINSRVTS